MSELGGAESKNETHAGQGGDSSHDNQAARLRPQFPKRIVRHENERCVAASKPMWPFSPVECCDEPAAVADRSLGKGRVGGWEREEAEDRSCHRSDFPTRLLYLRSTVGRLRRSPFVAGAAAAP